MRGHTHTHYALHIQRAVQHASAAASRRVQRGHGTDSISICRVKTINTLFTLIARAMNCAPSAHRAPSRDARAARDRETVTHTPKESEQWGKRGVMTQERPRAPIPASVAASTAAASVARRAAPEKRDLHLLLAIERPLHALLRELVRACPLPEPPPAHLRVDDDLLQRLRGLRGALDARSLAASAIPAICSSGGSRSNACLTCKVRRTK